MNDLKTRRKKGFTLWWFRGSHLLFRTKSIYGLLFRQYLYFQNTITGIQIEGSARLLANKVEKSSSQKQRHLSTLLRSESSIHFQVNRYIDNHNLRFCLSYRFRPFGLFRKSTHSSIGEIDQTWESV